MNREVHVRICEGRGVRFPPATRRLVSATRRRPCTERTTIAAAQPTLDILSVATTKAGLRGIAGAALPKPTRQRSGRPAHEQVQQQAPAAGWPAAVRAPAAPAGHSGPPAGPPSRRGPVSYTHLRAHETRHD